MLVTDGGFSVSRNI